MSNVDEGDRAPGKFRILWGRAAALGLALLLGAPTLLPGVLRAQASIRTQATVEENLADSAEFSEIPLILLGGTGAAIYPEYIDKCCYVGPVVLALALFLALRRTSWRDRRFYAALALVGLGIFFALGKNAGVHNIMPYLPVVRNLAGASRALVLSAAGLAILTALALDALTARPARRWGLLCLAGALAAAAGLMILLRDVPRGGVALGAFLARAWAVAPSALERPWFPLVDAALGLAAAGLILLLPHRFDRLRLGLLCGLLLGQLWHFEPRVHPPTERRGFFEPPPAVAFLQGERNRAPQAPFRVAGYDALRMHDTEFGNPHKFSFLMPNMATLYRLEDINGFDPLILKNYVELFEATAGRAPHNDKIRNLDIARPDLRLFDFLGVRFLAGHPYDRRLTTIPLTLTPQRTEAEISEWKPGQGPVTHWLFVALLDRALNVPLGTEVARLRVEAEEGTFQFPLRNGREVADMSALNYPPLARREDFRPTINSVWTSNVLDPDAGYRLQTANYRGAIAFGRPLHVRRAVWQILVPEIVLNVAAQAYRLAPPPPAQDPWVLRFGSADDVAPIYEYRNARPRAVLVKPPDATQGNDIQIDETTLNAVPPEGAARWVERGNRVLRLSVQSNQSQLLVLREIWDAGWHAEINGRPVPVLRVNGLLRGIELPAGPSEVRMIYRPRLGMILLALAGLALLATMVVVLVRRENP